MQHLCGNITSSPCLNAGMGSPGAGNPAANLPQLPEKVTTQSSHVHKLLLLLPQWLQPVGVLNRLHTSRLMTCAHPGPVRRA